MGVRREYRGKMGMYCGSWIVFDTIHTSCIHARNPSAKAQFPPAMDGDMVP